MGFFNVPRDGLLVAIFVSFAAHTVLLAFWAHTNKPAKPSSLAGTKPLFLSARQALSPNQVLPSPAQPQVQAPNKNMQAVLEQEAPKLSIPVEGVESASPVPVPQEPSSSAVSELKVSETGSVLPALLSEPIFPGGSPNKGSWGQRSRSQPPQTGNQGPAFVVPFLQSMTAQLAPNAYCDVKVSNTWTVAQISCTDSGSTSLMAGFLSQQLRMVNSLPDAGYCFNVKPGELNTLSCN
jgi:hypothetical protein